MKPESDASKPLILLCIFLLIVQIANGLYVARGIEPSLAFDLMYAIGFFWLIEVISKLFRYTLSCCLQASRIPYIVFSRSFEMTSLDGG